MGPSRSGIAVALLGSVATAFAALNGPAPTRAGTLLRCPSVLAVTVARDKYPGWTVYSNDPLRLTGADIAYLWHHEDATLDPDDSTALNDANLSVVQVFRLSRHPEAKAPELVCHFGEHAQLSRRIPDGAAECTVVRHRQFDESTEPEYVARCQ